MGEARRRKLLGRERDREMLPGKGDFKITRKGSFHCKACGKLVLMVERDSEEEIRFDVIDQCDCYTFPSYNEVFEDGYLE